MNNVTNNNNTTSTTTTTASTESTLNAFEQAVQRISSTKEYETINDLDGGLNKTWKTALAGVSAAAKLPVVAVALASESAGLGFKAIDMADGGLDRVASVGGMAADLTVGWMEVGKAMADNQLDSIKTKMAERTAKNQVLDRANALLGNAEAVIEESKPTGTDTRLQEALDMNAKLVEQLKAQDAALAQILAAQATQEVQEKAEADANVLDQVQAPKQ